LRQEGEPAGKVLGAWPPRKEMKEWADDSSLRERKAMVVERQVVDLYRTLLMRERIGEEFDGNVSGVTTAGLFVEIDDPYVEGLVRSERLDEEFELNDKTLRYESDRSGHGIGLGDRVRVRIDSVSVPQRRIELSLVSAAGVLPKTTRKRSLETSRKDEPATEKKRSKRSDRPATAKKSAAGKTAKPGSRDAKSKSAPKKAHSTSGNSSKRTKKKTDRKPRR
ncbi:MAG TPA: S1 RNA-binding domain-containing protein, partial [Pseudomonadota bacterium]|nr:S1 RNA-binding domain-containing protein [Pseudomonadota bacterium]